MSKKAAPAALSGSKVLVDGDLSLRKPSNLRGYTKLFFSLYDNGILCCAPARGEKYTQSLNIEYALISQSNTTRAIHIDSDRLVWHLRCHSDEEYRKWLGALREVAQRENDNADKQQIDVRSLKDDMAQISDLLAQLQAPLAQLESIIKQQQSQQPSHTGERPAELSRASKILRPLKRKAKHRHDAHEDGLEDAYAQLVDYHRRLLDAAGPLRDDSAFQSHAQSDPRTRGFFSLFNSRSAMGFQDATPALQDNSHIELEGETSAGLSDGEAGESSTSNTTSREESSDESSDESSNESSFERRSDRAKRRERLPAPQKGSVSSSVLGLLKKSIGKDLTKVSFPVTINEPLSAMQRLAEELKFCKLLHQAAASETVVDKLVYTAAFAVSPLADTKTRTNKKPFNAMLGETYELIREDMGFRFVSEKVNHHPPIHAFWVQSLDEKWSIEGASTADQSFWGRSLEVFPKSFLRVVVGKEEFLWKSRPSAIVRGILGSGPNTIEYSGKLEVQHRQSSARVSIHFNQGSKFGSSDNSLQGSVYDSDGNKAEKLSGAWDDCVRLHKGKDTFQTIWKADAPMQEQEKYYGMSTWACSLNEMLDGDDKILPPTDSRRRPDQRAYEEGDVDRAERTKEKLEEAQRKRRQEAQSISLPQYFQHEGDLEWTFKGEYWKRREEQNWPEFNPFEL